MKDSRIEDIIESLLKERYEFIKIHEQEKESLAIMFDNRIEITLETKEERKYYYDKILEVLKEKVKSSIFSSDEITIFLKDGTEIKITKYYQQRESRIGKRFAKIYSIGNEKQFQQEILPRLRGSFYIKAVLMQKKG